MSVSRMALSAMMAFMSTFSLAQAQSAADIADQLRNDSGAPAAGVAHLSSDLTRQIAVSGVRSTRHDAPVERDDLWHLGSNTKAMTATLAARLVEAGVVRWDNTISEMLSNTDLEIHPDFASATLEDLLHHRSGLPANIGLMSTIAMMGADDARDVRADRLNYARQLLSKAPSQPRGQFVYSNASYTIASLALEQVADQAYETLMQREVFEPLGMDSAGWGPPGVVDANDQPRGHRGRIFGGLRAMEPNETADNPPVINAAGRAHMSLDDVLDFLQAHLLAEDGPYLSEDSWSRLHAPVGEERYAMGWGVGPNGELGHSGSNTMWLIQAEIDPTTRSARVAVVNSGVLGRVSEPVDAALAALSD